MNNSQDHLSVMLKEVLYYMQPRDGEVYVDCTFGAGGYTRGLLEFSNCKVIAVDRDPSVRKYADDIKVKFGVRFEFYNIRYGDLLSIIGEKQVNGIVLDIGVSSMQIDRAERGFSFQKDARLDMRMGNEKISAYEIVNNMSEKELADLIYNYGDEVKSRHIAKKIVEMRKIKPVETTVELADIVRYFYRGCETKIDPATKTFQAIRIAVNDELNELKKMLEISKNLLKKDGRLVVVSFHSLEDKIVKDFIKIETNKGKKMDKYANGIEKADFELLTKKAISPAEEEIKSNIRARSAKLRALRKC